MSLIVILAAGLCSGLVPGPEGETLLAGPRVAPTNVTSENSRFTEPMSPLDRARSMIGANPRMLHALVQRFADGPEEVRLSDEQQAAINGHMREFMAAMRDFEQENRAEMARIRRAAGASAAQPMRGTDGAMMDQETQPMQRERLRERAQRPAQPREEAMLEPRVRQGTPVEDPAALRMRMMELNAKGPQSADLERTIRAVLNDAQRAYLDDQIVKMTDERTSEMAMQRYREEAMAQFAQANERMARINEGEMNLDNLPERIRERLAAMSPEDRQRAIENLRQRRTDRGEEPMMMRPNVTRAENPRPRPKVPPSMDQISVPKPESRAE